MKKRERSATSGDKVLSIAQRYRKHANPDIRAMAMSIVRQRDEARRARRAARSK